MSTEIDKLYEDLLSLSDKERAKMATSLIDSLDQTREAGVEQAWAAELERRIGEIDDGEVKMVSWPDARSAILKD